VSVNVSPAPFSVGADSSLDIVPLRGGYHNVVLREERSCRGGTARRDRQEWDPGVAVPVRALVSFCMTISSEGIVDLWYAGLTSRVKVTRCP